MITLITNSKELRYHALKSNVQKSRVNIIVHTAKPGMVIGRGGSEKDAAVAQLEKK